MARPLFEQYKDALRRGHLAILGDEFEAALEAYREAASLVPDRPLPHASMAAVLERLGRHDDALAAYDLALALAPDDVVVAAARAAVATPSPSAEAPEAEAPEAQPPEAEPVPATPSEPASAPEGQPPAAAATPPGTGSAVASAAAAAAAARAAASADDDHAAIQAMRAALDGAAEPRLAGADAAATGTGPAIVEPAAAAPSDAPPGAWPAIDLPSLPPAPLEGPPPDPVLLQAEADALLDAGDEQAARDRLILAALVHRDAGRLDAALDACLQLLAIAPGDPRVHLAIANLQLDLGWRQVATEKIELLLRLTSLAGDAQAEADVHLLAADRLRDESPARLDARRRGLPAP